MAAVFLIATGRDLNIDTKYLTIMDGFRKGLGSARRFDSEHEAAELRGKLRAGDSRHRDCNVVQLTLCPICRGIIGKEWAPAVAVPYHCFDCDEVVYTL